jgi:hypothetical protein
MLYKIFLTAISVYLWAMANAAIAQSGSLFDSERFWASLPANQDAFEAWKNGQKMALAQNPTTIVYHNAFLYGLNEVQVPSEQDRYVEKKLGRDYGLMAELKAINGVGLFALNDFDCRALARPPEKTLPANSCSTINLLSKTTSHTDNIAFSIIKLSANDLCNCKQNLEIGNETDNYSSFFGPIARQELQRLANENNTSLLLSFFTQHYKKKIFGKDELLLVADVFADNDQINNSTELLNILTSVYSDQLTSDEWEKCGDIYYKIDLKDKAYESYINAAKIL